MNGTQLQKHWYKLIYRTLKLIKLGHICINEEYKSFRLHRPQFIIKNANQSNYTIMLDIIYHSPYWWWNKQWVSSPEKGARKVALSRSRVYNVKKSECRRGRDLRRGDCTRETQNLYRPHLKIFLTVCRVSFLRCSAKVRARAQRGREGGGGGKTARRRKVNRSSIFHRQLARWKENHFRSKYGFWKITAPIFDVGEFLSGGIRKR